MQTATFPRARHLHPAMAYQRVHIESQIGGSATPHRLVSMLFDGAIEAMNNAKGAIATRNIESKGRAISRAVNIIDGGLRASLDLNAGGKLAQDLHALYGYMLTRLTYANLKSDAHAIDECIRLLHPIRDAWNAIEPGRPVAN
jgi:flagellar protein FliS